MACSGCRESKVEFPIPKLPALPRFVPLMTVEDYSRGNVRRYPSGRTQPIGQDSADRMKQGRREQRSGLLYDERFPGFEPVLWPVVVSPPATGCASFRLLLEGEREGEAASVVDICYDPCVARERMLRIGEHWLRAHATVRAEDTSAGRMAGVGDHLAYDGLVRPFVVSSSEEREAVSKGMAVAGEAFASHFNSRGVGFAEMLTEQQRLWRLQSWLRSASAALAPLDIDDQLGSDSLWEGGLGGES